MTRAGFPPWTLSKALDVSVNRSISSPQEHYVCGLECHLGLLIDLQHSYPAIPIHSLKYFSQLKSRALSNGDFFLAPSMALLLASWEFQFRKRSFHSVIHASDFHGSELFTTKTYTVWKLVRESMLGWEDEAIRDSKDPSEDWNSCPITVSPAWSRGRGRYIWEPGREMWAPREFDCLLFDSTDIILLCADPIFPVY